MTAITFDLSWPDAYALAQAGHLIRRDAWSVVTPGPAPTPVTGSDPVAAYATSGTETDLAAYGLAGIRFVPNKSITLTHLGFTALSLSGGDSPHVSVWQIVAGTASLLYDTGNILSQITSYPEGTGLHPINYVSLTTPIQLSAGATYLITAPIYWCPTFDSSSISEVLDFDSFYFVKSTSTWGGWGNFAYDPTTLIPPTPTQTPTAVNFKYTSSTHGGLVAIPGAIETGSFITPSTLNFAWIKYQDSLWYAYDQTESVIRVITATDFEKADFHANDWTIDPLGTARDVCLLSPPTQQFISPSLTLSIGSGSLTATLGSSTPDGNFQLQFFVYDSQVAQVEAGAGATTVAVTLPSTPGVMINAAVIATSRLPLPAWSKTAIASLTIAPTFSVNTGADGGAVSVGVGGSYTSLSYSATYGEGAASTGLTIHNTFSVPVTLIISGICDDDVMFDGVVYQPDTYHYVKGGIDYWWSNPVGHRNASHSFTYTTTLAVGTSLLIQGQDNGDGGHIECTVTFS